ncbi:MAG: ComEC/Rec2 family competence protein [Chloroflexi bacterium]|nr:ComEC/Rec2 family competence protein [Chloroflexota bacterium]
MWTLIWAIGWLVGVWLGQALGVGGVWEWVGTAALLVLPAPLLWKRPPLGHILLALALVAAGGARYLAAQPTLDESHIAFYNDSGQPLILTGMVAGEPDIRDTQVNLRVEVESVKLAGRSQPVSGLILVQTPRYPVIEYGTQVVLRGQLNTPPSNPEFSYRDYLARQEVYSLMARPNIQIAAERGGSPIYHLIYDAKARGQATIRRLMPDPEAGLLSGILLGIAHATPPDLDEDFRTTGISHIVVISGFNIAIVAALFLRLGEPLLGAKGAAVFATAGIALYTILVGAEASVVRAAIMGGVYVIAHSWLGRSNWAVGSLFFAGVVMTLHRPAALWDVGFQLSFAATLSLMLYATPLTEAVRGWLMRRVARRETGQILGVLNDAVLVTMAAQVLTLPLTMYYFQRLSVISLVANGFILPAQPGVMIWGGLATIFGSLWTPLGVPFGWVAYALLWYTIRMARLFARVPYAIVDLPFPLWALLLTYALIGLWTAYGQLDAEKKAAVRVWWRRTGQRFALGGTVLAALLGWQGQAGTADGHLHLHFFDAGRGEAVFIQTPTGRQILLDGGYYPTVIQDKVGQQMPFWDRELDVVLVSSPSADYAAGLPGLLGRYEVGQLWLGNGGVGDSAEWQALLLAAEAQNVPIHTAQTGEVIEVGDGVRLEILHTAEEESLVVYLTYGDFSALLMGAATETAERAILAHGLPRQTVVLKAGHMGDKEASTAEFLATVRPHIVVVANEPLGRLGYPHAEVLERVAAVGSPLLRTDQLGTLSLRTDGEQMWWTAQK